MTILNFVCRVFAVLFLVPQGEPREDGGQMGVGSGANCYLHGHARLHISETAACVYALTLCANLTEHHKPSADSFIYFFF